MDRSPSPKSIVLYTRRDSRRRVRKDFAADDKAQDLVILLHAPLIQKVLGSVLVKELVQQPREVAADSPAERVNLSISRLEIVVIDPSVVNPAAVVDKIREARNTARLLAFFAESPLIDSSAWLEAGVDVYKGSGLSSEEMVSRLRDLFDNEPVRAPRSAVIASPSMQPCISPRQTDVGQSVSLTAREKEVIRLIAAGESNKAIAGMLNIGVATVKTHVHNLLGKLGVDRRGKLALWRHGQSAISYRPVAGDDLTIAVPASGEADGGLAL
jgi:DNA-binding NarL/FixJ family response regulator